ncbi:histidine--tRNA ligase [Candidatus Micrarchaeota archaeon]|nr:histidine--tRNA ligase [Candidatus Micrarchaeota archaeon]
MVDFQCPRGMRDFLPVQMIFRERVISVIKSVFEKYGFDSLETPALERLDVLGAKAGEDVEKQVYKIDGGELGLRFDLTVPLARVVACNKNLPLPFKRYCVGRVWRRDEPQKGRFREFWQADVDVVGSASVECEAELLACACECLDALGFSDYEVVLNSRKVLDAVVAKVGVEAGSVSSVFRSLDKLEKIGVEGVKSELREKKISDKKITALLASIQVEGNSNEEKIAVMEKLVGACEGLNELRELLKACEGYGTNGRVKSSDCGCAGSGERVKAGRSDCCERVGKCVKAGACEGDCCAGFASKVRVDFGLVRGLDYYTGPVFEVKAGGGVGSVAGGGRYDGLIELYGAQKTPAVGISLGVERLMALLDERGGERVKTRVQAFVACVKSELKSEASRVAGELRCAGVRVQTDLMGRNLRKQFEYANALGIKFIVVVGEKELKEGKIILKNLESGVEEKTSVSSAAEKIKKAFEGS